MGNNVQIKWGYAILILNACDFSIKTTSHEFKIIQEF